MARTRTVHRCRECGATSPRWAGRCGACGAWNTLEAETVTRSATTVGAVAVVPAHQPLPIAEVVDEDAATLPTGVGELDRVLGGGLVAGSVTLVGGEPGVGKSTLLLQVLGSLAAAGHRVLYVTGEESAAQVRGRAGRIGAVHPDLWLVAETSLPAVRFHLDELDPAVLVVDSVQTLADPELESAPGSVAQVRHCAHLLVGEAKRRGTAVLLVGHVTKEGGLAGPRVLEHVVDTVLTFDGDRHHELRLLRAVKHRFGSTAEVGLLRMTGEGLVSLDDPSELFLADRLAGVSGSVVVPTVDGNRPLLVEVQALVAPSSLATPRRSAQGVDAGRLAFLLAVLERRVGLSTAGADVYALAVGGVRLTDPGADVGLALAVVSSLTGNALPDDLVAVGEVGLGGELRHVPHLERRLAEAVRLGFSRAIVPPGAPDPPAGLTTLRAPTMAAAVAVADLAPT